MSQLYRKTHQVSPFEVNTITSEASNNVKKPLRRSEDKLAFLEKLNMTIELEPLLATYTAEVSRLIAVTGLEFESPNHKLQLKYSKASANKLTHQLIFNNTVLGNIIYLSTQPLNNHQRQLLANVEQQLLQSLHNVLRFEHTRKMSMRDYLTGLGNRNYFEEALRHMTATAEREDRSFTLLFIDLDNFKAVNDECGHLAGDQVLIEFSRLLRFAVRDNDHVFRFGGDEFAILLSHSDHLHPEFVAQRIVSATATSQLLLETNVTASIGYANWQQGDNSTVLTNRSDKALYHVKGAGKNGYHGAA